MIVKRVAVLLYVTLIMFLSVYFILYGTGMIEFSDSEIVWTAIYDYENLQTIILCIAAFMLIMNYAFYATFSTNIGRDKIVAFDNPSGRVSVSLLALEDLVRRKVITVPEIKEMKTRISTTRKGLKVRIKTILRGETNIPVLTAKVQELVQEKIQDAIGLDSPVDVSIYVGKILKQKVKSKRPIEKEAVDSDDKEPPPQNVPFHGYRA